MCVCLCVSVCVWQKEKEREREGEREREKRQINVTQIFRNDILSFIVPAVLFFRRFIVFIFLPLCHPISILCPSWKDIKYVTYTIVFPGTPILLRITGCWRTRLCFWRDFLQTHTHSVNLCGACCAARYLHPAISDTAGLRYLPLCWRCMFLGRMGFCPPGEWFS